MEHQTFPFYCGLSLLNFLSSAGQRHSHVTLFFPHFYFDLKYRNSSEFSSTGTASGYMFRVNKWSNIKTCKICSKFTIKTPQWYYWLDVSDVVLLYLLLTLNIFHTFFYSFSCLLLIDKCLLGKKNILPNINPVKSSVTIILKPVVHETRRILVVHELIQNINWVLALPSINFTNGIFKLSCLFDWDQNFSNWTLKTQRRFQKNSLFINVAHRKLIENKNLQGSCLIDFSSLKYSFILKEPRNK